MKSVGATLAAVAIAVFLLAVWQPFGGKEQPPDADTSAAFAQGGVPVAPGLPPEQRFQPAAESAAFQLFVDSETAHFQLIDKASGTVWRSYPNPAYWDGETATNVWKNHLASPIVAEYVNARNYKALSATTSLIDAQGYVEDFQWKDDGFSATFALPKALLKIPVEVTLHDTYVETKIIDAGIVEGHLSLLNVKLYPLFGAQPSVGQDGYIVLPDGSGALVRFQPERLIPQLTYNESIYGSDRSYYSETTGRQRIAVPLFGIKSGEQAFAAIVTEGAPFANVFAAPSGAIGQSNWATVEWQYRKRFFQIVSHSTGDGFFTYSGDKFAAGARAVRYYPLLAGQSDYAGIASAYRTYLTEEQGVRPLPPDSVRPDVPLSLDIVGADVEKGLFRDRYVRGTTTKQAEELVSAVRSLGIDHIQVRYAGWQKYGYTSQGGYFPVDSRIGGEQGMRQFIDVAHSLDIPVYLTVNYTTNNNGRDGFWWRRDGLRNLAGTVLQSHRSRDGEADSHLVSPLLYARYVQRDLPRYAELGADGLYFVGGIGQTITTDFNSRYAASREQVADVQADILRQTRETLGRAGTESPNAYAFRDSDLVHRLPDSYSYDVFLSEDIPLLQMILHGLRPYSHEWSNLRNEFTDGFLRSAEYGAYPAYVLAAEEADDFRQAYSINYYSMKYPAWLDRIGAEYARLNEALAPVQTEPITGHRTLADNVKETTYGSGGYRIIVNYNTTEYQADGIVVPARDFVVVREGQR